ncbi:MAG: DNA polymerase III subunit delta' [Patescibacteria group bacterium]
MSKPNFSQNWGIVGHQNVVDFLKKSLKSQTTSHAYLFYGPTNIGKGKIVQNFIAALFCQNPESGQPCNNCLNCQQLTKNIHPDVIWLCQERDTKTKKLKKNISVDQIRELRSRLQKGSFLDSYKIGIVDPADLLNIEAANALLKILEEPADKVIIILLAEKLESLPQTIASRCQKIKFELVSRNDIYSYLLELGSNRQLADELSYLAAGRPGQAIKFYQQPDLYADYQKTLEQFFELLNNNLTTKLKIVQKLTEKNKDSTARSQQLNQILNIWSTALRDILLVKNYHQEGIPTGLTNFWLLDKIKKNAIIKQENQVIASWLEAIAETKVLLKNNINPQLALEALILNF